MQVVCDIKLVKRPGMEDWAIVTFLLTDASRLVLSKSEGNKYYLYSRYADSVICPDIYYAGTSFTNEFAKSIRKKVYIDVFQKAYRNLYPNRRIKYKFGYNRENIVFMAEGWRSEQTPEKILELLNSCKNDKEYQTYYGILKIPSTEYENLFNAVVRDCPGVLRKEKL